MSTIRRDYLSPARAQQAGASSLYKRFDRVWGKTTINGIQVYTDKMTYWDGSVRTDEPFKRFINRLGLTYSKLASQEYSGLDRAYFKLNSKKYTYTPMDLPAIANDLSSAFAIGDEFEVAVSYGGDLKRFVTGHWSSTPNPDGSYNIDTVAIRAMLNSDKVKYFANATLSQAGFGIAETSVQAGVYTGTNFTQSSTPVTKLDYNEDTNGKLYDCLAMIDDGTTFQQQGDVYTEEINAVETTDQYGNINVVGEYSYIVKFKVISTPLVSSYITTKCSEIAHAMANSLIYTKNSSYAKTNHAQDTMIKQAILLMDNPTSHPAFYTGYLRVDYAATMKRKEFVKLLGKIFDTGYKKKKTKWYKKAIAFVIIIVAVVIIVMTWYSGVGEGFGAAMIALGQGLMYAAVFLTVSMMIYAAAFPDATDMIGLIGRAAQIVGYSAAIVGVYNLIMTSWVNAGIEAGREAGSQAVIASSANGEISSEVLMNTYNEVSASTIANFGITDFVSSLSLDTAYSIVQSAGDALSKVSNIDVGKYLPSVSPMSNGSVSGWIDNIQTGMNMYNMFFVTPFVIPLNSKEESTKENGVENYYASISMMDNSDLLDRMDMYKNNLFGGRITENYLTSIA